jgi:hypothetical protein
VVYFDEFVVVHLGCFGAFDGGCYFVVVVASYADVEFAGFEFVADAAGIVGVALAADIVFGAAFEGVVGFVAVGVVGAVVESVGEVVVEVVEEAVQGVVEGAVENVEEGIEEDVEEAVEVGEAVAVVGVVGEWVVALVAAVRVVVGLV